jgi:hypothetical protein
MPVYYVMLCLELVRNKSWGMYALHILTSSCVLQGIFIYSILQTCTALYILNNKLHHTMKLRQKTTWLKTL